MQRFLLKRRGAAVLAIAVLAASGLLGVTSSSADLSTREHVLQQGIGADNAKISHLQGQLSDLHNRLVQIDGTLKVERSTLLRIQNDLAVTSARLATLRAALKRDRRVLAKQMLAQYESPPPTIVSVLVNANGFGELLNRVAQMRTLARHNGDITRSTATEQAQVAIQTKRLKREHARQLQVTAAELSQHDQVATLRVSVLQDERRTQTDRSKQQTQLGHVQHAIAVAQARARAAAARAAAAQRAAYAASESADTAPAGAGYTGGGYTPHGGEYGFFPAAGTNYSVNEEPELAARLDALGKALHLHLIGISGYRSPAHSVEVGGFADDPHTRGEASDTPGVEGVPEATLEQFGLTRPFDTPAEADHIQLLGG